ncbi:MAG TPA: hypothetical protein VGO93_29760, partial [Candidatus Xenobia bacterium]
QGLVEKAYQKQADAAAYKFFPGMWSAHSHDFVGYGPHDKPLNLARQQAETEQMLSKSLHVTERFKVLSFRAANPSHARCRVHDTMVFEQSAGTLTVDSVSTDDWVLTRHGWRMTASRLDQQKPSWSKRS